MGTTKSSLYMRLKRLKNERRRSHSDSEVTHVVAAIVKTSKCTINDALKVRMLHTDDSREGDSRDASSPLVDCDEDGDRSGFST